MRGEQAIFNLEIKKKSGSSINPDIHHSKVPSYEFIILNIKGPRYHGLQIYRDKNSWQRLNSFQSDYIGP